MNKKFYEWFWFVLSRLAAIFLVSILILEGFSRYLSDVAVVPGLLLGVVIFLVFFAR